MGDFKNKDFASLKRSRLSIGGSTYQPLNTLTPSRKSVPEKITESDDYHNQSITKPSIRDRSDPFAVTDKKIKEAQSVRHRLQGLTPTRKEKVYTSPSVDNYSEVRDCFGELINVQANGLMEEAKVSIGLRSFEKCGTTFYRNLGRKPHSLAISNNGLSLCIYEGDHPKNDFVINIAEQLKVLSFAADAIVMELNQGRGTIIAFHHGRDREFREYFQTHPCEKVNATKTLAKEALEVEEVTYEPESEKEKVKPSTLPKGIESSLDRVLTRSAKKKYYEAIDNIYAEEGGDVQIIKKDDPDVTESMFDEDDYVFWEAPAKFSPDLQYRFPDGKLFRINFTDFSTLYNNDWINDAVIDFCIKFDIEEAIQEGVVKREEIYAFNSFFYNKLNSIELDGTTPNYYKNVQRWVQRLDLMSFPYIVIPIHEKHHWYCCIIRGLPALLEMAQKLKQQDENESKSESTEKFKKWGAEIFVFDSLGLKRENVKIPLKTFIIDYCKDRHNVNIRKDQIRVTLAKVPKQNNYNDCGIHVLFNVKKWLFNMEACESLWRKHQLSTMRNIFVAAERNNMRKYWIDKLLELHSNQEPIQDSAKTETTHDDDDDDIEIIKENTIVPSPSEQSIANNTRSRGRKVKLVNTYLNETFGDRNLPRYAIECLNKNFPRRSLFEDVKVKNRIAQFIEDVGKDAPSENQLVEEFAKDIEILKKELPKQTLDDTALGENFTTAVSSLKIDPTSFFSATKDRPKRRLLDEEAVNFIKEKQIESEAGKKYMEEYDKLRKESEIQDNDSLDQHEEITTIPRNNTPEQTKENNRDGSIARKSESKKHNNSGDKWYIGKDGSDNTSKKAEPIDDDDDDMEVFDLHDEELNGRVTRKKSKELVNMIMAISGGEIKRRKTEQRNR
ncbi:ULP2 Ubiquitin-like-specific protease 2 [Candida maltosa Xu316]